MNLDYMFRDKNEQKPRVGLNYICPRCDCMVSPLISYRDLWECSHCKTESHKSKWKRMSEKKDIYINSELPMFNGSRGLG